MLSIFALLIDNIGWSMENILFTSVGVVLPVISIIAFFVLMIISLIRRVTGKSCKQTLIVALVFSGIYNYCNLIGAEKTMEEVENLQCTYQLDNGKFLREKVISWMDVEIA